MGLGNKVFPDHHNTMGLVVGNTHYYKMINLGKDNLY